MGGDIAGSGERLDRDPPGCSGCSRVTNRLDAVLREHWWGAVGAIARRTGDLEIAEDAVQEACAAAIAQWPVDGIPPSPRGWLITTAWHKAVDAMRRDSVRAEREAAAARDLAGLAGLAGQAWREDPAWLTDAAWPGPQAAGSDDSLARDDELALIFACCHPALDAAARVALTLRSVCGLPAAEIAAA